MKYDGYEAALNGEVTLAPKLSEGWREILTVLDEQPEWLSETQIAEVVCKRTGLSSVSVGNRLDHASKAGLIRRKHRTRRPNRSYCRLPA